MIALPPDPRMECRMRTIELLTDVLESFDDARSVEALVFTTASTDELYTDKVQQMVVNMRNNPTLRADCRTAVFMEDSVMAHGTIIADIERETSDRRQRFEQIMQEKYDMVNQASVRATLRCRRCGSSELSWEQKQTRGADGTRRRAPQPHRRPSCSRSLPRASRVHRVDDRLCTCTKCNNRWTMR
jgi:DNA-directed RNA polymerase subunit M/transcription elongation factor TFIIS